MTYEEKKAFLHGYLDAVGTIVSLTADKQRWRDIAEKVNQTITAAPGGGSGGDKIGRSASEIADIEKQIDAEIRAAEQERKRIKAIIDGVQNNRHKTVLRMVYISGMTFQRIADRLGKSERNIADIHKKAVESLQI